MNGIHDLGGMHGFGPVVPEAHEPVFHAGWEGTVFALVNAMGAWRRWSIDASRFAKEVMPPAERTPGLPPAAPAGPASLSQSVEEVPRCPGAS